MTRAALVVACVVLVPCAASAQRTDLGTLRIERAHPGRAVSVAVGPPALPDPSPVDLPVPARAPFQRWLAARAAIRAAASGDDAARATLPALDARLATEETALRTALERAPSLSRIALATLGALRHDGAFRDWVERTDRCDPDACEDVPPAIDPALEAWARVGGDDALAAEVACRAAHALHHAGRTDDARAALASAVDRPALSPASRVACLIAYAETLEIAADAAGAATALARAGDVGAPGSPLARLRAAQILAEIDRVPEALAQLVPVLEHPFVGDDARALAATALARHAARGPTLLANVEPEPRARMLLASARELADRGLVTWARAHLDAATTSDTATADAIAALRTQLAEPITDTPRAWALRAVRHCAVDAPRGIGSEPTTLSIRARFDARRRARVRTEDATSEPARTIAACLARDAPPAESPIRGEIRATIELAP